MVDKYVPQEIEPRWAQQWERDGLYRSIIDPARPKFYALTMLPYPSGDLHIGHWYAMAPSDARARWLRMRGYNVLFPMGFDAFGLNAENAAIKRAIHPKTWTEQNMAKMRQQFRTMGTLFDWEREAVTSHPEYYKWTQWFFLQFFNKGLAYRKLAAVDFCPQCNTTLAREQVWGEDRHCERCGTPVIKKDLEQWFFRTTAYADELLDHSPIDWPERVKIMQTNWIGRSEGAHVVFHTEDEEPIEIFTTRPDTLWGATFMVLAPEHPLVDQITTVEQRAAVTAYINETARKTEIDRTAEGKEKTGVFTGGYAINPVNGARIPVWIADYVLISYGSGAIMAVPAHDERDFEFALKFGLPIVPVIARPDGLTKSFTLAGKWMKDGFTTALDAAGIAYKQDGDRVYITMQANQADAYIEIARKYLQPGQWVDVVGGRWVFIFEDESILFDSVEADRRIIERCRALEPSVADKRTVMEMLWGLEWYRDALYHADYGDMIHSGAFSGTVGTRTNTDGQPEHVAKTTVTRWLEEQSIGHEAINYRLRDWLISRQRYWGAPIPITYCPECGIVGVPEEDLPVMLPDDVDFMPTGESPLRYHEGFLNTTCPHCGGPATRETDTMDTFMCSSWYQYRYLSPHYDGGPFDPVEGAYWLPVDQYTGGIEHATMHLMYTRFFTKAMRDCGVFEETERIARERFGRDTTGMFDEPMTRLFNQGMILGEPRDGHLIVAEGRFDGEKFNAASVRVVGTEDEIPAVQPNRVGGEVMKRSETTLHIKTPDGREIVVDTGSDTAFDIAGFGPDATINQIKHHLEVEKMSKTQGNVVAPDELVEAHGADAVRAYLMHAFRWEQGGPWASQGIQGPVRWLNEVWDLVQAGAPAGTPDPKAERSLRRRTHQMIRQVSEGLETFNFNTAVSALMTLKNELKTAARDANVGPAVWNQTVETMLLMMAPFTPFIAEELWCRAGHPPSIHNQPWPEYDPALAAEEEITLVVQINGKVRDRIQVPAGISEDDAIRQALESEGAQRHLGGSSPRKVIYVAQRGMVNIVV
ncbi:MAG: leucine--tRNA ligase [Chloroflexi bacterium]|nr:MAG: leucine--tRNA ligase [Chloroflexota bacterium]